MIHYGKKIDKDGDKCMTETFWKPAVLNLLDLT